ncbi:MAG: hypothetical protein ACOX6J_04275 [Oscillospiraceae bacterium]
MAQNKYSNVMLDQMTRVLGSFGITARNCTLDYISGVIPEKAMQDARKFILTGCGDSYCAGIAAKPVFENKESSTKTGMTPGTPTEALRNIEYTRYYNTYCGWEGDNFYDLAHALIAISNSGGPRRPLEALMRAKKHGRTAIAVTSNLGGPFAQAADYVVEMFYDKSDGHVNVINYVTSLYTCMMIGLYASVCKGQMTLEEAERQRKSAIRYVNSLVGEKYEEISEHAMDMSERWSAAGVDYMDFIGDGPDWATAFFGSAKMVESFGGLTTNDDSEDWNHINFFNRSPEHIGTFLIANEESPAFSREVETAATAAAIGRPLCVITDTDKDVFPKSADVFHMPKSEFKWIMPLMEHLPMDFVAAYWGAIKGIPEFCQGSRYHDLDVQCVRFKQSKLVVL